MKKPIPEIKPEKVSTLPKIILDSFYRGELSDLLFDHVKIDENINYYSLFINVEFFDLANKNGLIGKEGKPLTFKTIEPFLETYSKGFYKGFWEFSKIIDSELSFSNDEIKARKILKYTEPEKSGAFPLEIVNKEIWESAGIEAGHFYSAWNFISENHEVFLKYFEKEKLAGVKSFSWTGGPDRLRRLFDGLLESRVIDQKTSFSDFEQVFSDNLTQCKPIKLRTSNRLFVYFFNQLFASKFIDTKEWISVICNYKLFKNKSGNYFKTQDLYTPLSEINNIETGLEPIGHEKIDVILKNLKTG